ncbi:PREDICTED: zinc finger protein RFP-like isoform X1 [Crocodylus porosus]|uniref:zinc finger protein RFP-like isoform X1 n=1 Tax=Crocodylus porosus TaxID=8502 RepID=UPI00093DA0A5|nr:PREDICTED: zinc finger protein RFP-like isoform X1 [Crocodylus porosus]
MAAESPVGSLQHEATCSICLEFFKDPVILDCGHNFCRVCISQCWDGLGPNCSCPQCRQVMPQRNLRPNRQLANIVKITKQLSLQAAKGAGEENMRGGSQEALHLLCEETQTEEVCDRCHTHTVPAEKVAQEYKEELQTYLKTLREDKEKLLGLKVNGDERIQEYLQKTEAERQKLVSEFRQLHQFLEEQERLQLDQLGELEKEIIRSQNEKLSMEISRLSDLISEMERKCQQPASEFLQDVRNTLSRCKKGKFQEPLEIPSELKARLADFSQKNVGLKETLRKFKETLPCDLEKRRGERLGSYIKVKVTLDPDTAHPDLILSEDQKSVRWGMRRQDVPDNPQRFDTWLCVLGCEGFTSGKHCWEVDVEVGGNWAVGVAKESVSRKGRISLDPKAGIWAMWQCEGQYQALTTPRTPLSLSQAPWRIRVCLDYEGRRVAVLDADKEVPIFVFPPAAFTGERICPWFWVGRGSRLRL